VDTRSAQGAFGSRWTRIKGCLCQQWIWQKHYWHWVRTTITPTAMGYHAHETTRWDRGARL